MGTSKTRNQPADNAGAPECVQFYEGLLNAIPLPVFYKSAGGIFTGCNTAFERLTGFPRDKIVGRPVHDFSPRKLADIYTARENEVLVSGQALNYEGPIVYSDGETHDAIFHLEPLTGDKGDVIGLVGVIVDITERKKIETELKESRAELGIRVRVRTAELAKANEDLLCEIDEHRRTEDKLKCSEERYRAIIEEHPELIVRQTPSGVITFINEACRSYFGKARDEFIGGEFLKFVPPDFRELVGADLKKLSRECSTALSEVRIDSQDGPARWQQWVHRALFDELGKCIEIQSIGRDITERKRMEAELSRDKHFLTHVFSAIDDEVTVIDVEMNVVHVNAPVESKAVEVAPLTGQKCYRAVYGRAIPCEGCPVIETLQTGKPVSAVISLTNGSGRDHSRWYEIRSFPWYERQGGALLGAIENRREITGSRLLEEKNHEFRRRLAAASRERRELQEAERRWRIKMGHVSVSDSLTGLASSRFLHDYVERETDRSRRESWSFSIIAVDIDHFKSVHEVYGRAFADSVLKQLGHCLKRVLRRYDCIARVNSSEFVIAASGVDQSRLISLAVRIRDTVALHNFGDKDKVVKLTVTVAGLSFPHGTVTEAEELISSARRMVKRSQSSGSTNTVVFSSHKRGKLSVRENEVFARYVRMLSSARKKARKELFQSIASVSAKVARLDGYTMPDIEESACCAVKIASAMGMPRETQELVRQAVVVHDIGKAGIRPALLRKKSPLTAEELNAIRFHPQAGVDMIRPLEPLHDLIPLIQYHHERWDGSGYPLGARGDDIPVGARIVGLVDTYRALLKKRPYRKAYTRERAIAFIKKSAGSRFDPKIVCAFLNVVQDKP